MALNESQSNLVLVQTGANGRQIATVNIPTYPALFAALISRGFKIIGTTFVTNRDQLEGTQAIEFRVAALNGGWRLRDTFHAWRNVVSAAAKANDMKLLDISSRIAAGLQFSEMRLYDLTMSYSAQLHGHLKKDEPKEREAFRDTFSPRLPKSISRVVLGDGCPPRCPRSVCGRFLSRWTGRDHLIRTSSIATQEPIDGCRCDALHRSC